MAEINPGRSVPPIRLHVVALLCCDLHSRHQQLGAKMQSTPVDKFTHILCLCLRLSHLHLSLCLRQMPRIADNLIMCWIAYNLINPMHRRLSEKTHYNNSQAASYIGTAVVVEPCAPAEPVVVSVLVAPFVAVEPAPLLMLETHVQRHGEEEQGTKWLRRQRTGHGEVRWG